MVDLKNIKQYQVTPPDKWSIFGDAKEFDSLSDIHKNQIIFLDRQAEKFLFDFLKSARLIANNDNPFSGNNFKTVEDYTDIADYNKLKKWLYNRKIPFKTEVFLLGDDIITTTWKIVVKYSPNLFSHNDLVVFDKTLNWCLFYFHHNHLFFGEDNIYDSTIDDIKMDELNKLKQKYPDINFPY